MEKSWRLQRYSRKDYSELVEFPVEIVGRDGVVRRYTFEDSIRLYRRRITFAPIRYRDTDLIAAEVDHCRSRIDQLRRSYFYRFGWGTPEGQPAPIELFGTIAGELAAFICRVLRCEGRPEVRFEPLPAQFALWSTAPADPAAPVSAWYLVPSGYEAGMLLVVHRFDGDDGDRIRDEFFTTLKQLEREASRRGSTDGGDDGERLLAFHHTVDCGFVLTGRGDEFDALVALRDDVEAEPEISEPTPWNQALEVIRRGEYQDGLARCREIVDAQPWHRNAYVAGAVMAAHLEQPLVAEDFALVGSKYFPKDAVLHYYVGLARARQDRLDDALEPLDVALALQPEMGAARLLLAVVQLQRGQDAPAVRTMRGRRAVRSDDRRADATLDKLETGLFWRRMVVASGTGAALLGLVATMLAGWFGLVPVSLGLMMAGVGEYAFRRELLRMSSWPRFEDISQGLRRIRRPGVVALPPVS